MKRSKKAYSFVISLLLVFILLTSIVTADTASQLKIGLHSDESTITPYSYVMGTPGYDMVNFVYDTLFQMDQKNVPQPWLVKEYNLSADNLTYTFKLHENVKWHDGTEFTAEDVAFTYNYLIKYPKSRFTKPAKAIKNITVPDKYTVVMELNSPQPDFLMQPIADLPILPKHIWEKIENPNEASAKIGTGPFLLEEYKPEQYYKFTANPNYFKGTVTVKELIMPIIKDTTSLFTSLKAGEIDAATKEVSPELVNMFSGVQDIKLVTGNGFSTTLLQFNNERPPFDNAKFRKALSLAIDSKEIVDTVLLGKGTVGSLGFTHPSMAHFNKNLPQYVQDKQEAIKILDELGFKDKNNDGVREDGKGKKLEFELLVYASNPLRIRTAELISGWAKEIGISLIVKAMDSNTVDSLVWPDFDVSKGRDFDMTMWGWSPSMQQFPGRIVELYHSSVDKGTVNIGAYKSPQFDEVAAKLEAEYDKGKRIEIVQQLQEVVANDVPLIPLYYPQVVFAYNEKAYTGWKLIDGQGIINKLSFIDTETKSTPETKPAEDTKTENSTPVKEATKGSSGLTWIVIIVILGIAFVVYQQKKKK